MNESELLYASRNVRRRKPAPIFRDSGYDYCPGYGARGCGVRVPLPRILCYFCAKSARLSK